MQVQNYHHCRCSPYQVQVHSPAVMHTAAPHLLQKTAPTPPIVARIHFSLETPTHRPMQASAAVHTTSTRLRCLAVPVYDVVGISYTMLCICAFVWECVALPVLHTHVHGKYINTYTPVHVCPCIQDCPCSQHYLVMYNIQGGQGKGQQTHKPHKILCCTNLARVG